MNISETGLDFIKGFEAYMKRLPDGGCTAYQEVLGKDKQGKPILDIPTISWGCTEGVKMGDVWTLERAETEFRREIAKHEALVTRLVTTDLTQGQFDSLCSFSYNCGKLKGSTLLKKLNAGDAMGAADEFGKFTLAGGVRLKGLVRRRAGEKALFLSDLDMDEPEHCPQQADTPKRDNTKEIIGAATAVVVGGGTHAANNVGTPPAATKTPVIDVQKHLDKAQQVRGQVEQAKGLLGAFGVPDQMLGYGMAGLGVAVVAVFGLKKAGIL